MGATFTPDRTHYRQLVADVAARAKERLPAEVNGRLEGAVKLVLLDEVQAAEDGTITVGSCTDPTKTYRLVGAACECKDYTENRAPQGWCRHRIAAGLHKRVHEVLATEAASRPAPSPALPEAPVSITLKAVLHGHEVLVTLRGTDFASVQAQVEQASQWLQSQTPAPAHPAGSPSNGQALTPQQHNAMAQHQVITGWCKVHNVAMQDNEKDGRHWFSHYDQAAGRWCKGR